MRAIILLSLSCSILASCSISGSQNNTQSPSLAPIHTEITQKQGEFSDNSGNTDHAIRETTLKNAYSEERLAEDIYTKMFAKYPTLSEVANIIQSEEKHSEQVGKLLDIYNIPRPTDYGGLTETYNTLSRMVDTSLTGAIEAGVMIEVGDIDHLLEEYKKVDNSDIRAVFENIGGGSFNHLRAFLRIAESHEYHVQTDYARYMSLSDIHSSGPLQSRMTQLLQSQQLPVSGTNGMRGNGQRGR